MKKLMTIFGVIVFTSFVFISCGNASKADKSNSSQKEKFANCEQCGKKIVKGQKCVETVDPATGRHDKWFCSGDCELQYTMAHQ